MRRIVQGAVALAVVALTAASGPVTRIDYRAVVAAAAHLQAVSRLITGTPRQRAAGDLLEYHAFQDPIRQCMAQRGFGYTPPPYVPAPAGPDTGSLGIGDANWFAPLRPDSLGIGESYLQLPPPEPPSLNPGYTSLDEAGRARYNSALDTCGIVSTDVDFPPMSRRLAADVLGLMLAVGRMPAVKASGRGYAMCLARYGVTADGYDDLVERVILRYGPVPGGPAGTAWLSARRVERAAAAADVACRTRTYRIAMVLLGPRLDTFVSAHVADFAELAREWDGTVRAAAAYPESGPA